MGFIRIEGRIMKVIAFKDGSVFQRSLFTPSISKSQ